MAHIVCPWAWRRGECALLQHDTYVRRQLSYRPSLPLTCPPYDVDASHGTAYSRETFKGEKNNACQYRTSALNEWEEVMHTGAPTSYSIGTVCLL